MLVDHLDESDYDRVKAEHPELAPLLDHVREMKSRVSKSPSAGSIATKSPRGQPYLVTVSSRQPATVTSVAATKEIKLPNGDIYQGIATVEVS